ncbi:MAG: hypothetical protein Salg2KO_05950 [Salibacteraceae bacterium]
MNAKTFIGAFVGAISACFVFISLLVWYVDPYQFYGKNEAYGISENYRYQNPGLAKHYDYETILIGTSITHVIRPSTVDSVFNTETMKLTIKGSSNHEQYLMAKLALETGKPKRVIWGADYFTATREYNKALNDRDFPHYLYDDNYLNDWVFLFNLGNLKLTVNRLLQEDTIRADFNKIEVQYSKKGGLKQILSRKETDSYDIPGDIYKIGPTIKENVDHNMVELIEAYPEVQFEVYIAPYTVLFLQDSLVFERNKVFAEYLVEKLDPLPNVNVHFFQAEKSISHNFEQFVDRYHSKPSIGRFIVEHLKSGDYKVGAKDMSEKFKTMKRQTEDFYVDNYLMRE